MPVYRVEIVAYVNADDEDKVYDIIDDASGAGLLMEHVDVEECVP